ncbi:hypothetical protein BYI23_E001920 (plasmid) [Burkholderia sp. YI23]|nr:hypothetical protein BYI23_E001920 [Burkholderia sp. YI23]
MDKPHSMVTNRPHSFELASIAVAFALLVGALLLHLVPALFAGLITFALIHQLARSFGGLLPHARGKLVAVGFLALIVIGALVGGSLAIISVLKADAGLSALFQKMASILENATRSMPAGFMSGLPSGAAEIREHVVNWLREHASEMGMVGKEAGVALAHVLIGVVIGAMVALHEATSTRRAGPLAASLLARINRFADSFRKVVFAQVQISLINTCLTALYLAVVLPAAGVHLPFTKTMIGLTFVLGLLPVAGNLLSNAIIIVISISHSFNAAIASLAFLVVIHKIEYFLNARIVGSQIKAAAWELLLAMLVMESMFGVAGVAAAPIFYAYLKSELDSRGYL